MQCIEYIFMYQILYLLVVAMISHRFFAGGAYRFPVFGLATCAAGPGKLDSAAVVGRSHTRSPRASEECIPGVQWGWIKTDSSMMFRVFHDFPWFSMIFHDFPWWEMLRMRNGGINDEHPLTDHFDLHPKMASGHPCCWWFRPCWWFKSINKSYYSHDIHIDSQNMYDIKWHSHMARKINNNLQMFVSRMNPIKPPLSSVISERTSWPKNLASLVFQCKKVPCLHTQSPRSLAGACVVLGDPDVDTWGGSIVMGVPQKNGL